MFVFKVMDKTYSRAEVIEATTMIEAARKFLGRDVKKLTKAEHGYVQWACIVYKVRKDDIHQIPYAEGYYR